MWLGTATSCNTTLTFTHCQAWGHDMHVVHIHIRACMCAYTVYQSPKADLCHCLPGKVRSSCLNQSCCHLIWLASMGKIVWDGENKLVYVFCCVMQIQVLSPHGLTTRQKYSWSGKHLSDKNIRNFLLRKIASQTNKIFVFFTEIFTKAPRDKQQF